LTCNTTYVSLAIVAPLAVTAGVLALRGRPLWRPAVPTACQQTFIAAAI
jgi:hypothetical protein